MSWRSCRKEIDKETGKQDLWLVPGFCLSNREAQKDMPALAGRMSIQ